MALTVLSGRDSRRWRRLLAPGISAFICFCLLLGLGTWQLHRLRWKQAILAEIRQAELAPPVPLPAHPGRFQKVVVTGSWVPGEAARYGDEVHDGPVTPVAGSQLIQPLREASGRIVLVDLGWISEHAVPPFAAPGTVRVVGYVRESQRPGWFAGTDDRQRRLYYTLDTARIGADLGLDRVAPFVLVAMGETPPPGSGLPQPAEHLPQPPNNHYQYALTWFGLALVLLLEFIFFARKRLRDP